MSTVGFLAKAKRLDDAVVGGAERRWPWLTPKTREQRAARAMWLLPICVLLAALFWWLVAMGEPVLLIALLASAQAVYAAVLIVRARWP